MLTEPITCPQAWSQPKNTPYQFIEIKRKHGTEVVGFFYSQCTENLSRLHSSRLSFVLPLKMLLHWYSLCHQPVVYFINLLVKNGALVQSFKSYLADFIVVQEDNIYYNQLGFAVLDGLKYATSHEWVKHEGSVATIGITDHAQVIFSFISFLVALNFFLASPSRVFSFILSYRTLLG